MKNKSILIIGATSSIAIACAYYFAKKKYHLHLTSRNTEDLKEICQDLIVRYNISVKTFKLDMEHQDKFENIIDQLNHVPNIVLCSVGYMINQKKNKNISLELSKTVNINFLGPALFFEKIVKKMERKKSGVIIGISSVAGERGRSSNYIYGSSKSAFSAYLSGLRNRLYNKNIRVITILPGFVYSKMTEGLKLPKILTATPEEVAEAIYSGLKKKQEIIYVKRIWLYIMFVIRIIPETIFKKLNL